jgi:hypothetical protein
MSINATELYPWLKGEGSLWSSKDILIISPAGGSAITMVGGLPVNNGTITTSSPSASFGTSATPGATAGTSNDAALWQRGGTGALTGGFYFTGRFLTTTPVSSYDESRVFVGLTNQTLAASVASDNPAGHYCGFFRRNVGGGATDTNWQFATKNNVTLSLTNTGLAFLASKVYDFYIFCPLKSSQIFWRIDNVTDGTTEEGSTTTNIPDATILMRAGFQLVTTNSLAKAIRMQKVYVESDTMKVVR